MFTCDINRMEDKITTFSKFGDTGKGGITRFSLSPEAICARNEIKARMTKLGLDFKTDDIGNIYCTLEGTDPSAGVIMSGSHCDSVRQGGNYDGILGVLTAMEMIETIVVNKIPHKHPIQLVVWTNEEGARFEPAMMSSGISEKSSLIKLGIIGIDTSINWRTIAIAAIIAIDVIFLTFDVVFCFAICGYFFQ